MRLAVGGSIGGEVMRTTFTFCLGFLLALMLSSCIVAGGGGTIGAQPLGVPPNSTPVFVTSNVGGNLGGPVLLKAGRYWFNWEWVEMVRETPLGLVVTLRGQAERGTEPRVKGDEAVELRKQLDVLGDVQIGQTVQK